MYKKHIKRLLDIILSSVLIIVTLPFMIIIGILVLIDVGRPIFFVQERPGKDERIFKLIKFRTMKNVEGKKDVKHDELRVTKLGHFLRNLSLDEIPEIYNILLGSMSFVGPRPLLKDYLFRYNDYQKTRHQVKPGLTGLAQVNGRDGLSWEERFHYDVYYVNNYNFLLDLKIVFKTLIIVLKRKGVQPKDKYSMDYFEGNNHEKD